MRSMTKPRKWGPTHSKEYVPLMVGIISVCSVLFLSGIFPVLELTLSILVIISAIVFAFYVARSMFPYFD